MISSYEVSAYIRQKRLDHLFRHYLLPQCDISSHLRSQTSRHTSLDRNDDDEALLLEAHRSNEHLQSYHGVSRFRPAHHDLEAQLTM